VDREIGGGGIAATVRAPLGGAARAQAMTVAGIRSMAARETAAMARLRAIARPCAALKRRRCLLIHTEQGIAGLIRGWDGPIASRWVTRPKGPRVPGRRHET